MLPHRVSQPPTKQSRLDHSLEDLVGDPGLRQSISEYNPNDQDLIQRAHLQKGPCQSNNHKFSQTLMGGKLRQFRPPWFVKYPSWLKYNA